MLRIVFLSSLLLINTIAQIPTARIIPGQLTVSAVSTIATTRNAGVNSSGFDPTYKLTFRNPVQDKNFYLLSLFQRNVGVRKLLSQNQFLGKLTVQKLQGLTQAANCKDVHCFEQMLRFSDRDIELVARELEELARRSEFKRLIANEMRRSGVFIKHAEQADDIMLAEAWKDAANGMNRLLSIYGLGDDPVYKDIDRISFDVTSQAYRDLLKSKIREIKLLRNPLFFEPTLNMGLKLLEVNHRDEAGRYEPLETGENRAALNNLRKIRWRDYPYSFILVLGSGPQDSSRLSPLGATRTDRAAQLFLEHKAPLIMVSGGHVHPMQTPYCEAIEMKKYLMGKYKIPERAILIEPHARHTTTNFRNGARLAFRYGLPMNLKALVTSSADHIDYSTKEEFHTRCLKEMGYFPMESISRVSPTEAEFKSSVISLFFDARDPLDP